MTSTMAGRMAAALLVAVAIGGCGGAARAHETGGVQPVRAPSNAADTQFMTNMIGHHGQAVLIAGWAPTHGASPAVRTLAERIVVGQHDEIALMERWLREHGETVPAADSSHHMMPGMDHSGMDHSGMDHAMLMPGMLTAEQLAQLDQASGPEFDRLFLTFMIKHHQGALTMVDQLFGSQGAAQDETVFRLASDVYADQSTEIERMQKMLAVLHLPS